MPQPRIYCPEPLRSGATIVLPAQASEHLLKVLRLRAGDAITVFDGTGIDYAAVIAGGDRRGVQVDVGAGVTVHRESPLDLTLLQGISRGPRMDTVIQKATELGVTRIRPVLADRSVVKLDPERSESKLEHWQRVAISACEQCGRAVVPQVLAPVDLGAALGALPNAMVGIVLDPDGDTTLTALVGSGPTAIVLAVGPEGGFTDDEIGLLARRGFARARLGPRILRTETAPVVALGLLQAVVGDLQR